MFTRLLVGLDGSPQADVALEQGIELGRRFFSTLVVVHVQEGRPARGENGSALLERARDRTLAAGLAAEIVERAGEPDLVLAELARETDAALVGRRGASGGEDVLGPTASSLIRIAERCVIVCGGSPSPMRTCAVAFDGRETSKRALELAARFAGVTGSAVHVVHASDDPEAASRVVGEAEAALSLAGIPFTTHVEAGRPGEVVARVIERTRCDALFAGAHIQRLGQGPGRPSPVLVSHAEEILRHTDIAVVIQP